MCARFYTLTLNQRVLGSSPRWPTTFHSIRKPNRCFSDWAFVVTGSQFGSQTYFLVPSAMLRTVATSAKPYHVKRAAVILVVCLWLVRVAAIGAWLRFEPTR